nr:DUF3791 domain-containing protein [Eubacterium sp.]
MNGIKEMKFSIFLINCIAEKVEKKPSEVYEILDQTQVLDEYIIPCYDVLHTLGREYLVEDICELVKERGGTI